MKDEDLKSIGKSRVWQVMASIFLILYLYSYFKDFTSHSGVSQDLQSNSQDINLDVNDNEPTASSRGRIKAIESETHFVSRVVDGDTIEIDGNIKLRYIGIDTPEDSTSENGDCFAKESYEENKKLVEGKYVSLEKDVSETDKYGRLLRYVYVDGVFVNEYLVREGYANVATYPPDVKYSQLFIQMEKEARKNGKGLWGKCMDKVGKVEKVGQPNNSEQINNVSGDWDCSRNIYDCLDFSTHDEAQNAFEACGGITYDMHKLDRDADGIACETLP